MKTDYIKHKITNMIVITKIVTIHYYELDTQFFFEGESHNFWELVYVDSGFVEIKTNSQTNHLKQGDLIFHKPNEFHTLKADRNSPANVFIISFVCSSKYMDFFKKKIIALPHKLKSHISAILDEYNRTFNSMASDDLKLEIKKDAPIGGQQMIRTHLEQLLILLIRNEQEAQSYRIFPSKETMENHLVSQMMNSIENNIYKKISVDAICGELNYSRAYLSKIFKLSSGYTIIEYAMFCKINEAKKLIRNNTYNFTQISDMLNFDNPHYFSKVFKRVTNMTPTDYKSSVSNRNN